MSISKNQEAFSLNVARLIECIYSSGYKCTFGEAFRTSEQAQWNVDHHIGILDSLHCKRLAVDLNLFSPSDTYVTDAKEYKLFGDYWETLNPKNRWGGRFTRVDLDHFEMNAAE